MTRYRLAGAQHFNNTSTTALHQHAYIVHFDLGCIKWNKIHYFELNRNTSLTSLWFEVHEVSYFSPAGALIIHALITVYTNLFCSNNICHSLICFTCPCACLHPLQVSPIFHIIPWVFKPVFSVCLCQLALYVPSQPAWFPVLLPFLFSFASPPGFDPCLWTRLPDHTACPDLELASHSVPPGLWPCLWYFACLRPFSCLPLGL